MIEHYDLPIIQTLSGILSIMQHIYYKRERIYGRNICNCKCCDICHANHSCDKRLCCKKSFTFIMSAFLNSYKYQRGPNLRRPHRISYILRFIWPMRRKYVEDFSHIKKRGKNCDTNVMNKKLIFLKKYTV